MAKEINGVAAKLAFGDVDNESVILQSLEQHPKVLLVCLGVLASDQDVVDVDEGGL